MWPSQLIIQMNNWGHFICTFNRMQLRNLSVDIWKEMLLYDCFYFFFNPQNRFQILKAMTHFLPSFLFQIKVIKNTLQLYFEYWIYIIKVSMCWVPGLTCIHIWIQCTYTEYTALFKSLFKIKCIILILNYLMLNYYLK